jgi:phosphoribosyl 1,2-cyclic phosphodiesterase
MDGVFISHDHSDHTRCAGVYHRKFGLPIYATRRTYEVATQLQNLGPFRDVNFFQAGQPIDLGKLVIETIPTPHDAAEGVGFVINSGGKRLGILTDLGHVFAGLENLIATLDAVLLESNYDPHMLVTGPYPPALKKRIAGDGGHLSNAQAAGLLSGSGEHLQWACLAHLSEENNTPDVALATHRQIVPARLPIHVASRYEASGEMRL